MPDPVCPRSTTVFHIELAVGHSAVATCWQDDAWDPFRHDEGAQRLLDPVARSAAAAAETQLQVRRLQVTMGITPLHLQSGRRAEPR